MPEIPEIYLLARQMDSELSGKVIAGIEILQPKCLNISPEIFVRKLSGARLAESSCRGKWIQTRTSQ